MTIRYSCEEIKLHVLGCGNDNSEQMILVKSRHLLGLACPNWHDVSSFESLSVRYLHVEATQVFSIKYLKLGISIVTKISYTKTAKITMTHNRTLAALYGIAK